MDKLTTFDKIQKTLFDDPESISIELNNHEIEIKERYKQVFVYWLEKPYLMDIQIIRYMMLEMGLSKSQAYRDLPTIKLLLGNVKAASKEFIRWQVTQILLEAVGMARKQKNPIAMAMAADKIGKYCKLDKEELDAIPWEEIQLPILEPSADIKTLDPKLKEYTDEARKKLREKYLSRPEIQEAEIIDDGSN